MNKRIEELIVQAGNYVNETYTGPVPATFTGNPEWHKEFDKWTRFSEKFAELIVQECIGQCQREWYDLNNTKPVENETARDIGIRVGQKTGVLKCINQINKHFGVE
jgi:hypothetical protein